MFASVQFSSVAQSCRTLCDPMNRSTPGLPVHHQLPEFTPTQVHPVGDVIQPSHPLSSPSPPAPSPSQHQSFPMSQLFAWGGQSTGVSAFASFLPKNFPGGSDGRASVYNAGDLGSIPGLGRYQGEGNGNPRQDYCLEIPWTEEPGRLQAHGVAKSQTQLSDFTFTSKEHQGLISFRMDWCVFPYSVTQLCPTLCHPMDCSPPGFSVHGIIPARRWSELLLSLSGNFSDSGIEHVSPVSPVLQAVSLPLSLEGSFYALCVYVHVYIYRYIYLKIHICVCINTHIHIS